MKEKSSKKDNEQEASKDAWHFKLLGFLIVMIALNLWMSNLKPSGSSKSISPQEKETQVDAVVKGFPALTPLAQFRDPLNITIVSIDNIFDPISFINVLLDPEYMDKQKNALKTTRRLSLELCYSKNCSAHINITWSMKGYSFSKSISLIKHFPSKESKKHNLIGKASTDKNETADGRTTPFVYTPFLQPVLILCPVIDFSAPLSKEIANYTPIIHHEGKYGPALYVNNFWILRKHLHKLTENSLTNQNFTVELLPLTPWKLLVYEKFDESMQQQVTMGLAKDDAADEVKSIFLDNNPYFLALTALVTVLHMLFEYLALANDVKFWRGRKDFKGLSLRTVVINCYFQTVIFLYLYDSNETSWSILLPSGIGVLMEYWKILQCITLVKDSIANEAHTSSFEGTDGSQSLRKVRSFSVAGYRIEFQGSYDKKTRKHDETAVRWLIYCMAPILIGYSIYSLVYSEHKSWYSFFIHTQVQFIYFFGFAAMTPQIFVNYKLKSVGQLPWRTFVYKALNTVIDDFFAFIITMPWLHRLACFRDDVVFAILLYQRWIYPVDSSRIGDDEGLEVDSISTTEQSNSDEVLENSKKNN
ncbi:unnamed protein product [Phytomonas sp. EM1]|nr:unnamed protein product [Phytomonas sp. EM1]|eukprot:CCW60470.1 unnamed protein product [Phytomonas sp. isolate EM1]